MNKDNVRKLLNNCSKKELIELIFEIQIIQLIAEGQKRKDIAITLYISERTLSNHLQHIFEKLDVTSAVEAVTKAIQLGYIPPIC